METSCQVSPTEALSASDDMQNSKWALTAWVSQVDGTHKASAPMKTLGRYAPDQQVEVSAA